MARFFFHLRNGVDTLRDPEGQELADLNAACISARSEIRSLIAHEALAGEIHLDQRIDVSDFTGSILHSIEFADAVRVVGKPD